MHNVYVAAVALKDLRPEQLLPALALRQLLLEQRQRRRRLRGRRGELRGVQQQPRGDVRAAQVRAVRLLRRAHRLRRDRRPRHRRKHTRPDGRIIRTADEEHDEHSHTGKLGRRH